MPHLRSLTFICLAAPFLCFAQSEQDDVAAALDRTDATERAALMAFVQHLQSFEPMEPKYSSTAPMSEHDHSALYEVSIDIPELGEVRASTVLFRPYSATIDEVYLPWLAHFAETILRYPQAQVRVEAHTDSVGDAAENLLLSQRRARAVEEKLLELGVPRHRLHAVGHGERFPLESNRTREGRMANRRVEFRTFFPIKR